MELLIWARRVTNSEYVRSLPGSIARDNDFFRILTVDSQIPFLCCPPTGTNSQVDAALSAVTFSQLRALSGLSFSAKEIPADTRLVPRSDTILLGVPILAVNSLCFTRKSAVL